MKRLQLLTPLLLFTNLLTAQIVKEVTSSEANSLLKKMDLEQSVIIDGRTPSMYTSGHIKGAIQINAFADEADEKLKKYLDHEKMLVYCTNSNRSETIIEKLKSLGYAGEIIFMKDGITGWKNNGFAVVTNEADNELKPPVKTAQQLLPGFKPIVQVFGTAAYNAGNQHYSYGFGRAHLGFQYDFSDQWSGKIIIDQGRPTTVGEITVTDTERNPLEVEKDSKEGSYYTMFLKFASLSWKVNDRLSLESGALLQNHYITQERFWGLRYVAQTFQDMYWQIPSTDLGFMARYRISDVLGVDAALTNGEGPRRDQDSEGAVKSAIGLDVVPSESFQTRLYYHNLQAKETGNENEQMFSAFAGFRPSKKLKIGAEYNHMAHFRNKNNLDSYGFSAYSVFSISQTTDIFGRFDHLAYDQPDNVNNFTGADSNALIGGISHMPVNKVRLSLNYQGHFYDENTLENKNSVMLSMEYKF
ncbi:MAG: rhodanese-like domain-containing protein [Marinilabiliaceae bacterium]